MCKKNFIALAFLIAGVGLMSAQDKLATKSQNDTGKMEIRTIRGQGILSLLEESKEIENELMKERTTWQDKIKKIETELKKKLAELEAKSKTVVSESLEKLKEEIEKLQRNGKSIAQEAETVLKKKFESMLGKLNKKIQDKVNELAEKKGWDIVIMQEAGVVFASKRADITQMVADELNAEYKKTNKSKDGLVGK